MKLATIYLPARVDQLMRQLAGYDHAAWVDGEDGELTVSQPEQGDTGPTISVGLMLNKLHQVVENTPPSPALLHLRDIVLELEAMR